MFFSFFFFFDSEAEDRSVAKDVPPRTSYSLSFGYKTPTSPWPNHTHPRHQKHYYASSHWQRCVRVLILKKKACLIPNRDVCHLVFIVVFFALRCGVCSSSGARVGHGSDCSHLDCGLCLALEEQVCVLINT